MAGQFSVLLSTTLDILESSGTFGSDSGPDKLALHGGHKN